MSEQMTLTDWRGNPYTVGTTVLYPRMSGRSCEICEGVVVDIWEAVYDRKLYKWVRANPDKLAHQAVTGRDREMRVKIQPNGRGSRDFYRSDSRAARDENGDYVYDDDGHMVFEKVDLKPVTLTIIENVTVLTS
ncbi:hypothetical protein ACIBH1_45385 [Nonomuraea sp. NPDC050663]|uniref:hypothetical protein n=1 Tax=Nonomuraea sp. NPDC050663 TaxID=3364370 RepID=UPI0037BAF3CC